jgi:hypothetical protein
LLTGWAAGAVAEATSGFGLFFNEAAMIAAADPGRACGFGFDTRG